MSSAEIKKTYGLVENPLNKKLIAALESSGEDVLVFPQINAERLDLTKSEENHLKNLADFDWIIFGDVLAADFFIEFLRELDLDFFELDNLTVCALGEAVADRLRFVQLHADVIPSKINSETVFSAISDYTGFGLEEVRFLIVKGNFFDFSLVEKLRAEKAFVGELTIYEAGFSDDATNTKLKTLLMGGAIDEFIFSSPEDFLSLKYLLRSENLSEIFMEMQVSATSEVVFQTLQEAGLRPLYFHRK